MSRRVRHAIAVVVALGTAGVWMLVAAAPAAAPPKPKLTVVDTSNLGGSWSTGDVLDLTLDCGAPSSFVGIGVIVQPVKGMDFPLPGVSNTFNVKVLNWKFTVPLEAAAGTLVFTGSCGATNTVKSDPVSSPINLNLFSALPTIAAPGAPWYVGGNILVTGHCNVPASHVVSVTLKAWNETSGINDLAHYYASSPNNLSLNDTYNTFYIVTLADLADGVSKSSTEGDLSFVVECAFTPHPGTPVVDVLDSFVVGGDVYATKAVADAHRHPWLELATENLFWSVFLSLENASPLAGTLPVSPTPPPLPPTTTTRPRPLVTTTTTTPTTTTTLAPRTTTTTRGRR